MWVKAHTNHLITIASDTSQDLALGIFQKSYHEANIQRKISFKLGKIAYH